MERLLHPWRGTRTDCLAGKEHTMRTPLPPFSAARSRRGISLIEVLIVMVLVGILAAVAIPRIAGSSDPYAAVDEAREIHAAMANARARAIATQLPNRFVLASGAVWKVEQEDPEIGRAHV